ncbi:MAG: hypothetical protein ABI619_09015 [Betaproteobacteria bacterium]
MFRAAQLARDALAVAIDTASAQGFRRPLLAYLKCRRGARNWRGMPRRWERFNSASSGFGKHGLSRNTECCAAAVVPAAAPGSHRRPMNVGAYFLGGPFCVYLAVVVLTAVLLHRLRTMPRLFSLIALPGTAGHELLHFLIGTLTLARPVKASLLPKFHRDGSATLGYVMFANIRWYNALWVGFAPLLALPLALGLVYYRSAQVSSLSLPECVWAYVAASLAYACLPSKADVRIVLSEPGGLLLYGAALLLWTGLQVSA